MATFYSALRQLGEDVDSIQQIKQYATRAGMSPEEVNKLHQASAKATRREADRLRRFGLMGSLWDPKKYTRRIFKRSAEKKLAPKLRGLTKEQAGQLIKSGRKGDTFQNIGKLGKVISSQYETFAGAPSKAKKAIQTAYGEITGSQAMQMLRDMGLSQSQRSAVVRKHRGDMEDVISEAVTKYSNYFNRLPEQKQSSLLQKAGIGTRETLGTELPQQYKDLIQESQQVAQEQATAAEGATEEAAETAQGYQDLVEQYAPLAEEIGKEQERELERQAEQAEAEQLQAGISRGITGTTAFAGQRRQLGAATERARSGLRGQAMQERMNYLRALRGGAAEAQGRYANILSAAAKQGFDVGKVPIGVRQQLTGLAAERGLGDYGTKLGYAQLGAQEALAKARRAFTGQEAGAQRAFGRLTSGLQTSLGYLGLRAQRESGELTRAGRIAAGTQRPTQPKTSYGLRPGTVPR